MAENIVEKIASQPKSYEIDGEKITNQSIPEAIEAEKYLNSKKRAKDPWHAISVAKISTEGPER